MTSLEHEHPDGKEVRPITAYPSAAAAVTGDWWISIFPGVVLAVLILSVNLLGDWMRDAFNPKLR
jgi:ABC-type dipeptide/oligopeptide/nickel transport system permease subunit